jgi:hypothetical protein
VINTSHDKSWLSQSLVGTSLILQSEAHVLADLGGLVALLSIHHRVSHPHGAQLTIGALITGAESLQGLLCHLRTMAVPFSSSI